MPDIRTTDARAWGQAIEAWCEGSKKKMDRVSRLITVDMLEAIVMRSPVDTGLFRGNWQVSIGSIPLGAVQIMDRVGQMTIAKGTAKILGLKAGQRVYIVNNLPYARAIEYGHSRQAPAGVVRITVAEFRNRLKQAALRARNESR